MPLALGERVRRTEVGVSTSYWIYIPAAQIEGRDGPEDDRVEGPGITDFHDLEAGRWRYAISLGVIAMKTAQKAACIAAAKGRAFCPARRRREQRVHPDGISGKGSDRRRQRNWRTMRPTIRLRVRAWIARRPEHPLQAGTSTAIPVRRFQFQSACMKLLQRRAMSMLMTVVCGSLSLSIRRVLLGVLAETKCLIEEQPGRLLEHARAKAMPLLFARG